MATDKSPVNDAIWKAQAAMRKNSMIVPGAMCFLSSGLVLYQHIFPDKDNPMLTWLSLILATMLPLAYVDSKISACSDPLGLMFKWGPKVLLMHLAFLLFRMRLLFYPEEVLLNATNVGGVIVVVCVLVFAFKAHENMHEHLDVACLVLIAFSASLVTEMVDVAIKGWATPRWQPTHLEQIVMSSSDYTEILAFVPAIMIMFKSDKKGDDVANVDMGEAKKRAIGMALFFVGFYLVEDAFTSWLIAGALPMRAISHVLHFLLMADFSFYLLGAVFNPADNKGTMLQRFADCLV